MKILIIGAGPIGCYAGRLLQEAGCDVEIIEEHEGIGSPVHCSGLVSGRVFSESRIPIPSECITNRIEGAEFFFGEESFQIRRKDAALVIDRERFDSFLSQGLKIKLGRRFIGLEKQSRGYLVETSSEEFSADIVIGSDGASSLVRRLLGFDKGVELLRGAQFKLAFKNSGLDTVKIFFTPPYFGWLIPESKEIVKAGIISENPYQDLIRFLDERKIRGEVLEKFAGFVPIGLCASQAQKLALLGDAACQVKPITHGGIYFGMRCAEILADCISAGKFSEYEKNWRSRFKREIDIGLKVRKFYSRLSREDFAKLFSVLKSSAKSIEEIADFESHSGVISFILNNPRLQIVLGKLLINLFKDSPI